MGSNCSRLQEMRAVRSLMGVGGVGRNDVELVRGRGIGPVQGTQQAVHLVAQGVQLIPNAVEGVLAVAEKDLRLQLTHDAAHVFPAQDQTLVGAAVQIARLPPGDAADVVADVGIAHGPDVPAALDDAGGITGDAADVRGGGEVFGGVPLAVGQVV